MALSNDLISQLVKVNKEPKKPSESTSYGTTVVHEGQTYVKLDGSDLLTPVNTTSSVKDGDRVTVLIKNHSATVTGNMSDPSASGMVVETHGKQISEFEVIVAYKVKTEELEAINATINNLEAKAAKIDKLEAVEADIKELRASIINTEHLTATDVDIINAKIENLEATFGSFTDISTEDLEAINADIGRLKAYTADFTYVSAEVLEAMKANIKQLDVDKLSAKDAEITYANIDFANINMAAVETLFAKSGLIKDLVVDDQTITGELVGVTIRGDRLIGNTVVADKLVVKGDDGLYYKLNIDAGATVDEEITKEALQNGLHGNAIIAKSITAEKIKVSDLVAFGATIGGFEINSDSIHSVAKTNVDSGARGVYMDRDGQVAFGDSYNFLKYYKDADGTYKLEIKANSLLIGTSNKTVEEYVSSEITEQVSDRIDNLSVGAINHIRNSDDLIFENYYFTGDFIVTHDEKGNVTVVCGASATHDEKGNVTMRSATTTTDNGAGNVTTI